MPKVDKLPATLRPYDFHGVRLDFQNPDEALGQCPFCDREQKFYVKVADGQWHCKICQAGNERNGGGNAYTFIRALWEACFSRTAPAAYAELARDRGLLYPDTLVAWNLCRSVVTGDWLVPGYSADGKLVQLYRYLTPRPPAKRLLLPTPGLDPEADGQKDHQRSGLFGLPLADWSKPELHVCEGPWDGMAWWEALRITKVEGNESKRTGAEASSLLAKVNVVAAPGGNSFQKSWAPLGAGKSVSLLNDSDHPKLHCKPCGKAWSKVEHQTCPKCGGPLEGPEVAPAGFSGSKRAANLFRAAGAKHLYYLNWGPGGFDAARSTGLDLRDGLKGLTADQRPGAVGELLGKFAPAPEEWFDPDPGGGNPLAEGQVELETCLTWDDLVNQWKKCMKWIEGLDRALSVMIASVITTPTRGEQLWFKIVGPPGCGKTELCEAVSTARQYVLPKDTITGLLSGYQVDRSGSQNVSLVGQLRNMTLAIKDGDNLLQQPNLPQILGQLRALFDRAIRSSFGNLMSKDWEGMNVTVLLCGTESLRKLDSSELGERMLDCQIVGKMDADLEREITRRGIYQVARDMECLSDGKMESRDSEDKVLAKKMTGGYITHLRRNYVELVKRVAFRDEDVDRCSAMAEFVAFMRSRPSKSQEEVAQRELSTRLGKQIFKLARALAVVLNRPSVDREVLKQVRQVCLDTSRGRTFDLVKLLFREAERGAELETLCVWTAQKKDKETELLQHLRKIDAVELFRPAPRPGVAPSQRWRLTKRLSNLYREVVGG